MNELIAILNKPLLQLGGESITLLQLLGVPLAFFLILFLAGWVARAATLRMRVKEVDANLIQVINRAYWVVVISVLFLTVLGMLRSCKRVIDSPSNCSSGLFRIAISSFIVLPGLLHHGWVVWSAPDDQARDPYTHCDSASGNSVGSGTAGSASTTDNMRRAASAAKLWTSLSLRWALA